MSHLLVEFTFQSLVESLVADLHSPSNSTWFVLRGSSRKRCQWHCSTKLWFFLSQNPMYSVHSMGIHHRLFPHVVTAQATQLWNQLTFLSLQIYILHLRDEFLQRLTSFLHQGAVGAKCRMAAADSFTSDVSSDAGNCSMDSWESFCLGHCLLIQRKTADIIHLWVLLILGKQFSVDLSI